MDVPRPLFDWPLEQLAEHAEQHARNPAVLARIQAELGHRPGSRALLLARRIERRLALDAPARTAGHELRAALLEIDLLRRNLAEADLRIEELERTAPPLVSSHGRVFLTANAPEWFIHEARRAFRRHHHPDRHTDPAERRRAEVAFKRAEHIFATLLPAAED
ncbi:hypothetical protein [Plastoroseomonas arctica]|uniref:J domain-containing protein n=1 Tax=Plastoroseomonas arctica TaxID=1509237 RepID=A0AAF1KUX0_9PROT|nr:hypothetical protein [Plastoroseomonas arctica]MBR0657312.1 hypothetical protein [Plastoroseomonas arctica]